MSTETTSSSPNSSSKGPDTFHPASPLTKADVMPTGIDGVTRTTSEHHSRRGRPRAEAPRKMDVHKPRRTRGYETTHKTKQAQGKQAEDLIYPSDAGALLIEQSDTQVKPQIVQPKKEGEPAVIPIPDKSEPRPFESPLETIAKESAQPPQESQEAQSEDTVKIDEAIGEERPAAKPKRPSVARRELRAKTLSTETATESPKTAEDKVDIETSNNLPADWKIQDGSVELPDGRRIVKNIATGETMVVHTKGAEGEALPAEQMKVVSARQGESAKAFLAREIPGVSDKEVRLIDEQISKRATESDTSESSKIVTKSESEAERAELSAPSETKERVAQVTDLTELEQITQAEILKDEEKADYLERRYGVESEEEYIARLKERDIMTPGQKGALTAERNKIQKYLESLQSRGESLPEEYLERLQDLNLALDNAKRFEPGIENTPTEEGEKPKSQKAWSLPTLTTERLLVPTPVVEPPGPVPPTPEPPTPTPVPPVPTPTPGPPEPPPPVPPEPTEVVTLYALDARETDMARARLHADERINTEMREIRERLFTPENPSDNRFFRMVQTVARGVRSTFRHPVQAFRYVSRSTFLREGYRQQYLHQRFGQMEGPNFHNAVAEAVAARFDLGEDYLQNGENILREDRPEVRATKDRLNQIFEQGIAGTMDRATVLTEAQRALAEAEWIGNGSDQHVHMVQNLEQIYDRITASVEHEAGLGAIDAAYRLAGGETTLGVNAEASRTTTDRIMERLTNSRLKGWLVNEATVAVAVGAVVNVAGYLARSKGARIAAGALIGGPVGIVATAGSAALFSAARERMTLRQERALRMSQVASGEEGLANNPNQTPRTAEIDATLYDMVAATDVLAEYDALRPENPATITEDQANNIRAWLVALRTNQTVGDEGGLDLIRYTSEALIEDEKTDLMEARAEAERILAQYASAHPDYMDAIPGASFEDKLNHVIQLNVESTIEGEISTADREFRRLSNSRAAKRAFATFAFASAGSYISAQITEHFSGERAAETITHEQILPNQNVPYGFKGDSINMPEGWKLEGGAIIDAQGNKLVENIELRPDGGIPQSALDQLEAKGIGVSETVQNHTTTVTREVPFNEYMVLHPEKFHTVHRELWMSNDTPGVFDLNELGGDFRLDPNTGDIILHTDRMTNEGSFWGAVRVAAHTEQVDGKLRWLFTPDKGNQSQSMILEVEPGGTVVIPKGSEIHSLFNVNPQATGIDQVTLRTGYAEVAVPTGRSTGGAENFMVLATQAGDQPPGTVAVTENVDFQTVETTLVAREVTTEIVPGEDWQAPFIPIAAPLPRRPMERIAPQEQSIEPIPYGYGYNGQEIGERERARWSDRLRNDPTVNLDPQVEIPDFLSRIPASEVRLASELIEDVEPMTNECRAVVTIPVAGHQEGKNIYNTLRWYSGQTDLEGRPLDPNSFEIVVYVNKPTDAEWDDTPEEIERFRRDFPDFPVRVITHEYSPGTATIGRIRRDMLNAILLRQQARGAKQEDIMLISHDADLKGIGRSCIATVLEGFDAEPVDAISGRLDWGPDAYVHSPLLQLSVKFAQAMDLIGRHPEPGDGKQPEYQFPGNNFAFRASAYAAIGGYDELRSLGEDVMIGLNISAARDWGHARKAVGFAGGDNIIYSDPRRDIEAFNRGLTHAEQWSRMPWVLTDDVRVSSTEINDPTDYDVLFGPPGPEQQRVEAEFLTRLEDILERTILAYGYASGVDYTRTTPPPDEIREIERALRVLRVKASIISDNGRVRIRVVDASRMIEYLRLFKETGPRHYAARTDISDIFDGGISDVYPDLAPTT